MIQNRFHFKICIFARNAVLMNDLIGKYNNLDADGKQLVDDIVDYMITHSKAPSTFSEGKKYSVDKKSNDGLSEGEINYVNRNSDQLQENDKKFSETIILRVNDRRGLQFLYSLLEKLEFIELAESEKEIVDSSHDFFKSAGLWRDRNINQEIIRNKAWKRG